MLIVTSTLSLHYEFRLHICHCSTIINTPLPADGRTWICVQWSPCTMFRSKPRIIVGDIISRVAIKFIQCRPLFKNQSSLFVPSNYETANFRTFTIQACSFLSFWRSRTGNLHVQQMWAHSFHRSGSSVSKHVSGVGRNTNLIISSYETRSQESLCWQDPTAIYCSALLLQMELKKTPWSESASELYRPSDRRLSAKWLPTFADRGWYVVSLTDPYGRILSFLDKSCYFSILVVSLSLYFP
jgi:hypothetical protein